MKKLFKQMKWDIIVTSVLYIILGIVAILIPETMVRTLGYLIGSLLILAGAVSMICYLLRDAHQNYYRNEFLYGLVGISIGIIVLYKVEMIVSLVPIIMGLMVLISGCRKLQDVIDMKRMEYGNWVLMLALAAVNVIFGVVLIFNPFETVVLLFQLVGAGLIFSGITDCIITFYFAGKITDYFERMQAVDSSFVEIVETGKPSKNEKDKKSVFGTEKTDDRTAKTQTGKEQTGKKSGETGRAGEQAGKAQTDGKSKETGRAGEQAGKVPTGVNQSGENGITANQMAKAQSDGIQTGKTQAEETRTAADQTSAANQAVKTLAAGEQTDGLGAGSQTEDSGRREIKDKGAGQ